MNKSSRGTLLIVALSMAGCSATAGPSATARGPSLTPTLAPTASITPTPSSPVPIGESRSLEPDTTYLVEDPVPYTIRVPEGWQVQGGGYMVKIPSGRASDEMMSLNAWLVDNVYPDPCRPDQGPADPPVGPGVDDLVAALSGQFAADASPTDVTIDGSSG